MKYSNFSSRLFAFILDGLILGLPYMLIISIFVFPIFLGEEVIEILKSKEALNTESFAKIYSSGIKVEIAMIFVWGAICALFLSSKMQATPGKKVMKLQVVNENGERVKFANAFGRIIALPLIILTLQTPERYMIYDNLEEINKSPKEVSEEEKLADYLQTPITSLTNIITLLLIAVWFLNINRDREKRAFHDILFGTRVINVEK